MNVATQFAAAQTTEGGLTEALGIDWRIFIFQAIAFVILVWLLGKYVYPILIRAVDERQEKIEASSKAAAAAEKKAEAAKEDVDALLAKARKEAAEIVTTAKEEATAAVESADAKAKARADYIVSEAHEQIEKDLVAAKKALQNETLSLVALATEKVVGKTVSGQIDQKIIASAVKEVK